MRGLVRDTVAEFFVRKSLFIYAALTAVGVLAVLATGALDTQIEISGSGIPEMDNLLEASIVRGFSAFMALLIFISVMATAGVFPNMLIKGRADYFLSKPLTRTYLYLNKLFGIWLVYGGAAILSGLIICAAVYLTHGFFSSGLLYLLCFKLISLFIWLSITTLVGITSGSATLSIVVAFLVWVAQWLLGMREWAKAIIESNFTAGLLDVVYYVVPKSGEMADIGIDMALGRYVRDWQPLFSSLAVALCLVLTAAYLFRRKDF